MLGYSILNHEDQLENLELFPIIWSLKIALVCVWRILLDRLEGEYSWKILSAHCIRR